MKNLLAYFRNLPQIESHQLGYKRIDWLIIFLLLGISTALRLPNLSEYSLWLDEAWRVAVGQVPLKNPSELPLVFLQQIISYDGLLRLMTSTFGYSEWSVRIMSGLAGTLAVPATYLLSRQVAGRKTALVAALLMALSPFHITYSQEAAAYAIGSLATILFFYGVARLSTQITMQYFLLASISAIIMGIAHIYLLFLVFVVLSLYALLSNNVKITVALLSVAILSIIINIPSIIAILSFQDTGILRLWKPGIWISYPIRIINAISCGPLDDEFAPTIGPIYGFIPRITSTFSFIGLIILTTVAAWKALRSDRNLSIWIIAIALYMFFLTFQSIFTGQVHVRYAIPIVAIFYITFTFTFEALSRNLLIRIGFFTSLVMLLFIYSLSLIQDPPGKKWKPDVRSMALQIASECAAHEGVAIIVPEFVEVPLYEFYLHKSNCLVIRQPAYEGYYYFNNRKLLYRSKDKKIDEDEWFVNHIRSRKDKIKILYIASERAKARAIKIAAILKPDFNKSTFSIDANCERGSWLIIRMVSLENLLRNREKVE